MCNFCTADIHLLVYLSAEIEECAPYTQRETETAQQRRRRIGEYVFGENLYVVCDQYILLAYSMQVLLVQNRTAVSILRYYYIIERVEYYIKSEQQRVFLI